MSRKCLIESCDLDHYARGYCKLHYQKHWRRGDHTEKRDIELSLTVMRISKLFAVNPAKRRCAYDVSKALDVPYRTAREILQRLERAGWLTAIREPCDGLNVRKSSETRPSISPRSSQHSSTPRRLYRITGTGHFGINQAIAMLSFTST